MKQVNYQVPFYSNTTDDTHCYQAALRMVLKYFLKDRDFTLIELETMTAKVSGLWTWPTAGMLWMKENGFDVIDMEVFDYRMFAQEGEQYLIDFFGEKVGVAQIKHSYIPQEIELAKELLGKQIFKLVLPTYKTILKYLDKGYLVICNVNSHKLNNEKGYAGHYVVMKGYNEFGFTLHDPGLPAQENRFVNFEDFEKAWAYPNKKARNIIAFKLK